MGRGTWDSSTYSSNLSAAKAAGRSTFDYSDSIRSGKVAAKANDLLDPLTVHGDVDARTGEPSKFAGTVMRECCISDEHPNPTAIAIVLDVTGSNIRAATAVHAKLPQLFGLLQRKGYIEDPQILIGAIGDANSDAVPLQMGQFESDNRIDAMVEAMYLEGNGGGQMSETYELGAYFLAYHTHLEPVEKQDRKGFSIFIGDERPYDVVKRDYSAGFYGKAHTLEALTGDTVEADIPTAEVFEKLAEQYEVFFLFQRQGAYREEEIMPPWRKLLGENALVLEDPNNVCEFIAGLLAMRVGGLDLDEMAEELGAAGFDANAIASVSKTLATVGGGGGRVAKTEGDLGVTDAKGTDRL